MKKTVLTGVFFSLLTICLFSIMSAISPEEYIPPEPMAFYGRVHYSNNTAIPNGYYIRAKIGEALSGECEVIGGTYGTNPPCIIITHSTTNPLINFYIGNYSIGEKKFVARDIVNLDFIIDSLPERNLEPVSNGICEISKGECAYNVLDCDNSITSVCIGDGHCDSVIGETCMTAFSDCGECSSSTGGGENGGSGGGSRTNTGSSSGLINLLNLGSNSKNNSNETTPSGESGNRDSDSTKKQTGINLLTGFVVGIGEILRNPYGILALIFVASIFGVFIVLRALRIKNSKKNK